MGSHRGGGQSAHLTSCNSSFDTFADQLDLWRTFRGERKGEKERREGGRGGRRTGWRGPAGRRSRSASLVVSFVGSSRFKKKGKGKGEKGERRRSLTVGYSIPLRSTHLSGRPESREGGGKRGEEEEKKNRLSLGLAIARSRVQATLIVSSLGFLLRYTLRVRGGGGRGGSKGRKGRGGEGRH